MEYVLAIICVVLVILPPKYDPAVRLKLWMIEKGWSKW